MPPTTWYCVTTSLPPHACRAVSRCRWSTSTWKNPLAWREIQIPQLQDPQRQGTRSASPDYSKNWQNRFLYQIQPKKLQAYVRDVANICLSVYLFGINVNFGIHMNYTLHTIHGWSGRLSEKHFIVFELFRTCSGILHFFNKLICNRVWVITKMWSKPTVTGSLEPKPISFSPSKKTRTTNPDSPWFSWPFWTDSGVWHIFVYCISLYEL